MQETTAYTTGPFNQYTAIERGEEAAFEPVHDADGNQTLIRTSTGIWQVAYNAENRPVRFVNESAKTVVECTYDYMGRRHTRKVSVNGTVSSYLRYMYRGYLQIAAIDAVSGVFRWFLFRDPTQPEATRPLAIRKDGTWYAYGWDLTGNVTEIFGKAGYLRTVYTYTPYGEAAAEGDVTQPIQWSSEYSDDELGLVYYNYRHLNPHDGRWISRDPIMEQGSWNLFAFVNNNGIINIDILGCESFIAEDMQSSIGGVGVGYEVHIKGKTLVKIDGQNFYMEYSRRPSPGHTKTPPGKLWMYNKNNKTQMYRLDAPHGKLGWHHNVSTPISKVKGFKIVDHSERGAWPFKQTITIFKWGGRALFFVGGAVSLYEIYHAEDRVREIIRQVSGWAGATAGSLAGGKVGAMAGGAIGSAGAGVGAAPGAVVGAGIGALIGGVTGWWVGTSIAERVYDWIFTELEKEEYEVVCAKN